MKGDIKFKNWGELDKLGVREFTHGYSSRDEAKYAKMKKRRKKLYSKLQRRLRKQEIKNYD